MWILVLKIIHSAEIPLDRALALLGRVAQRH